MKDTGPWQLKASRRTKTTITAVHIGNKIRWGGGVSFIIILVAASTAEKYTLVQTKGRVTEGRIDQMLQTLPTIVSFNSMD